MALMLTGKSPEKVPLDLSLLSNPQVQHWLPRIKMIGRESIGRRKAVVIAILKNGKTVSGDAPLRNLTEQEIFHRLAGIACLRMGEPGNHLVEVVSAIDVKGQLAALTHLLQFPCL